MNETNVVIFGAGDVAQIAGYYFQRDGVFNVAAYTVDQEYMNGMTTFENKPLIPFADVEHVFPPDRGNAMFIALSYSQMNRLRERKCEEAKRKGFSLLSYVSPHCTYLSQFEPGENCFIFEDNTIQPFVKIGDNVTLWSGNHIGHHSTIESHNFISSHVVISGHCHIETHCFLGVNSTLAHYVRLATGTLVGAGAVITKNTEPNRVYVAARPVTLYKSSDQVKL
jgi:sugar O-acyltransferase (sialic acid O-acetyltransferase NeuD family)